MRTELIETNDCGVFMGAKPSRVVEVVMRISKQRNRLAVEPCNKLLGLAR